MTQDLLLSCFTNAFINEMRTDLLNFKWAPRKQLVDQVCYARDVYPYNRVKLYIVDGGIHAAHPVSAVLCILNDFLIQIRIFSTIVSAGRMHLELYPPRLTIAKLGMELALPRRLLDGSMDLRNALTSAL